MSVLVADGTLHFYSAVDLDPAGASAASSPHASANSNELTGMPDTRATANSSAAAPNCTASAVAVLGTWSCLGLSACGVGKIGHACGEGVNVGGEGEIRTHEPREGLPVFKTGAFNRSATSPFVSQALGVPGRPSGSAARAAR